MNPAIEFFRGIAALMVLTSHYYAILITHERGVLNFLYTGYDAFFVISGFVFGRTIYGRNDLAIGPYLIRRYFRIYPLYVFSLILYYIFQSPDPNKLLYFIKHLLFLQTTTSFQEAYFFNGAYWTLPVEIEFYLLVPILAIFQKKYKKLMIPSLFVFSILLRLFISYHAPATGINGYRIIAVHLPGILVEFIIGIMLFSAYENLKNKNIHYFNYITVFILGIFLIVYLGQFYVRNGDEGISAHLFMKSYFSPLCALAYALILFSFLIFLKNNTSALKTFCLFMGKISFGLYLFHSLIPKILNNFGLSLHGVNAYLLCLTIVIFVSLLFNYLIENPLRFFGRNLSNKLEKMKQYR